MPRRLLLVLAGAGAAAFAAAILPDAAAAHGLVGRQDLPIPRWLFAWAAAVVLVASFVGLAVLWPRPRLEHAPYRRLFTIPLTVDVACGAIGVVAFGAVVWAGFAGTQTATANLSPTVIYVVFWVGIPCLTLVLGNWWSLFNPWRAVARAIGWGARRAGAKPRPRAYPHWLGRWPAAAGIVAFAWVELVYVDKDDPSKLAIMALAYAAVQLAGMAVYGIERWERDADPFAVYFWIFSLLAPLRWDGRRIEARPFLSGTTWLDAVPGTVALLCVMIGTTSFDGFSNGALWTGENGLAQRLQDGLVRVGFSQEVSLELAYSIGLVAMILLIAGVYRLGVVGMRSIGGGFSAEDLARRFIHTLIPISFAYVVAHYFSLLAYQSQAMAYLVSDPLGDGSNYLGTANVTINYNVITATGIWYVQVAALVLGHVSGLTLAHDRALVVYDHVRRATRSQYWMLAVMVAFTSLGLWILSEGV